MRAEKTPCGEAEYQLLASTKEFRQPPVLPTDTCIVHDHQIGLQVSCTNITSLFSFIGTLEMILLSGIVHKFDVYQFLAI